MMPDDSSTEPSLDGIEALLKRSQDLKENATRLLHEAKEIDDRIEAELEAALKLTKKQRSS